MQTSRLLSVSTAAARHPAPASTTRAYTRPSRGPSAAARVRAFLPGQQNTPSSRPSPAAVPPPTVNWHLTPHCNYSCRFCFATFDDTDKTQALKSLDMQLKVLDEVVALGFTRVTFVGGEPLLHPNTDRLIHAAKERGLNTCLVTNGSLLTAQRLEALAPSLDILAFSLDASTPELNALLGRGLRHEIVPLSLPADSADSATQAATLPNGHIPRVLALCPLAHKLGITLKVNTVVTRLNLHDDMGPLIAAMNPKRWKIFQVMPVEGQNTGSVEALLVTPEEFQGYVHRARTSLAGTGVAVVEEDNDTMRGSYAMMDARGCFFTSNEQPISPASATDHPNNLGHKTVPPASPSATPCAPGYLYGPSVLEVGGAAAWAAVASFFEADTFLQRGGVWDYGQGADTHRKERAVAERAAASAAAAVDCAVTAGM